MTDVSRDEPCPHCGRFANRAIAIDAVIIKNRRVLLVQRGVEPDKGLWATPGGYVEWDETTEETAAREVKEETGLTTKSVELVGVYSSPNRHPKQGIAIFYLVEVEDGEPTAGDDAQTVQWFSLDALPERMAFDHKQNLADAKKYYFKKLNP